MMKRVETTHSYVTHGGQAAASCCLAVVPAAGVA